MEDDKNAQNNQCEKILSAIFNKHNGEFSTLIKSTEDIPYMISFLSQDGNKEEKENIINHINSILNTSPYFGNILIKSAKSGNLNIWKILIELYLISLNENEFNAKVSSLMTHLLEATDCPRETYAYMYRKLKIFFAEGEKDIEKCKEFLKGCFELLAVLFGKDVKVNEVRNNYIYFSGKGKINIVGEEMKLSFGIRIAMSVYAKEMNEDAELIKVVLADGTCFKLGIKSSRELEITVNEKEVESLEIMMEYDIWTQVNFIIKPRSGFSNKKKAIILSVFENAQERNENDKEKENDIDIENEKYLKSKTIEMDENIEQNIKSIIFLENFHGMCTSILISYKGVIDQDDKEKLYYKQIQKGIFNKETFNKYISLINQDDKKYSFYVPFRYNEEDNSIEDIFLQSKAQIIEEKQTQNASGVYIERDITDTIFLKGGITSLLPIAEHLLKFHNGALLNSENSFIFESYLNLINFLLSNKRNNIWDAIKSNFFPAFSLLLEQFPKKLFSERVYIMYSNIIKTTSLISNNNTLFFESFCLNEVIILKFPSEIQIKFWDVIEHCLYIDTDRTKSLFSKEKIWMFLKQYDQMRLKEYCCEEHRDIFLKEKNENKPVMFPEMTVKIHSLIKVIQILCGHKRIGNTKENEPNIIENNMYFFKLLANDMSPCLQKSLLELFKNFFSDIQTDIKIKKKIFSNFLESNCLKIIQYLIFVCSVDVKVEIICFLDCISDNFWDLLETHLSKNKDNTLLEDNDPFFEYLEDNILFDNFKFSSKQLKNKDDNYNLKSDDIIIKEKEKNDDLIDINQKKEQNVQLTSDSIDNSNNINETPSDARAMLSKQHCIMISQENNNGVSDENCIISNEEDTYQLIVNLFDKKEYKFYLKRILEQFKHWFFQNSEKGNKIVKKRKSFPYCLTVILNLLLKFLSSSNDLDLIEEMLVQFQAFVNIKSLFPYLKEYFPSHTKFKFWLIDTMFHSFIISREKYYYPSPWLTAFANDEQESLSENRKKSQSIFVHSMNIFQLIINHKIPNSFEYLEDLFKFMLVLKAKVDKDKNTKYYSSFADFIKETLNNISPEFLNYINNQQFLSIERITTIKNYINFLYDYYFLFNESERIIQGENNIFRGNTWKEDEHIDIPKFLYDGMIYGKETFSFDSDELFFKLYSYLEPIWSFKRLLELSEEQKEIIIKENQFFSLSDEHLNLLITKLVINQKKYTTVLMPEVKSLFFSDKEMSIIQTISIFLTILLSQCENESKMLPLINRYQIFLLYLFIQTSGYLVKGKKDEKEIQIFTDIIAYNLCFIFNRALFVGDELFMKYYQLLIIFIMKFFSWLNFCAEAESNKKIFKNKNYIDNNPIMLIRKYTNDNEPIRENFLFGVSQLEQYRQYPEAIIDEMKNKKEQIKSQLCLNNKIKERLLNTIFSPKNFKFYNLKDTLKDIYLYNDYSSILTQQNNNRPIKINEKEDELVMNAIKNFRDVDIEFFESFKAKEVLNRKKRLKQYRKIKKNLFSWNGPWSERELFFTEKGQKVLKYKVLNYLTAEMTRPLIEPVLDLDYYLPKFKLFKKDKMFYDDEDKPIKTFKVNLNLSALLLPQKRENYKEEESNDNDVLYQNLLPEMWKNSKRYKRRSQTSQPHTKKNKGIRCCMVKQNRHIRGELNLTNKNIRFFIDKGINKEKFDFYDKDRELCFGSFFDVQQKDQDCPVIYIEYKAIKGIFKRRYFYGYNSIEIYTSKHKSYFIKFLNRKSRDEILKTLLSQLKTKGYQFKEIKIEKRNTQYDENIVGYYFSPDKKILPYSSISNLSTLWLEYKISTFEFLIWLNILSGRSYTDLSQYPVFPWLFDPIDQDPHKDPSYRRFSLPMGSMNQSKLSDARLNSYIENYNSMKEDFLMEKSDIFDNEATLNNYLDKLDSNSNEDLSKIPYYFGSHYSNPTYVNYYMVRLFPYAQTLIEIQGSKFDDPQRIFVDIKSSYFSASTQKCDVRELIPEFFFFPEMFTNINNFNFGEYIDEENNDQTFIINNVILPKWCNNDPNYFVATMRSGLDNRNVKILKWIALIFGDKQRGRKAREAKNIYLPYTYEYMIDIEDDKWNMKEHEEERNFMLRYVEFGVTPMKTVNREIPERKEVPLEVITINEYGTRSIQFLTLPNCVQCHVALFNSTKLVITYSNFSQGIITIASNLRELKKQKTEYNKIPDLELQNFVIKKYHFANKIEFNEVYCTYGEGKYTAIGGFWDGRLIVLYNSTVITIIDQESYKTVGTSPITFITIEKNDSYAYYGTKEGSIFVYEIVNFIQWEEVFSTHDHSMSVAYINSNMTLNLFASCAHDGYINLYTKERYRLVRSIYMNNFSFDFVLLSAHPLACFVSYSAKQNEFIIYSINGTKLKQLEVNGKIYCPILYTSYLFCDYLIYQDNEGYLNVFSLPYMEFVKKINQKFLPLKWILVPDSKQGLIVIDDNNLINVIFEQITTIEKSKVSSMFQFSLN